jgi:hypothetical protein
MMMMMMMLPCAFLRRFPRSVPIEYYCISGGFVPTTVFIISLLFQETTTTSLCGSTCLVLYLKFMVIICGVVDETRGLNLFNWPE